MYFNLISSVFICIILSNYLEADLHTDHLPDAAETPSLEVNIEFNSYFYTTILVECKNYDSLQFFKIRQEHFENFVANNGIHIEFVDCFNNETDNKNYNYNLMLSLANLTSFNTTKKWNHLRLTLNEYAIVNSDVFLNHFDFQKFKDISIRNVGFKSTEFLNLLDCYNCIFESNNFIDFNDFNGNMSTVDLMIMFTKILNFNKLNLKKFHSIRYLKVAYFDLDDYNAFNVPALFEHNADLYELTIEDSTGKIMLHERVFAGLRYLTSLALQDLRLDYVHKNLFADLTNLKTLLLSSNNIKRMEANTFEHNKRLTFVSVTDNPFFTEQQEAIEYFNLGPSNVELFLANFTEHTLNLFEHLVKNPKVRRVLFQSILIDPIDLNEFTRFQTDRETPINIKFLGNDVSLDLDKIKSVGINIKSEQQLGSEKLSAIIKLPISGATFCYDCAVLKQIFPFYLSHYRELPGFYFNNSRVLVIPNGYDLCYNLEEKFDEAFVENCPISCNCKYNPLLDKIKIYCNNKNLTEIPVIPYPVQFTKIDSIDLNFENNLLSVLTFANQDEKVLKKLSTLLFRNNQIEAIEMVEEQSKFIKVFDICDNPVVTDGKTVHIIGIGTHNDVFDNNDCRHDATGRNPQEYIQQEKATELDSFLDRLKCK